MRFQYKDGEKLTRFSIRKYHFGAASVAIASLIFFGGVSAKAENIPTAQTGKDSSKIENVIPSRDKNTKVDSKPGVIQDKAATIKKTTEEVVAAKVDKTELKKLSISLETLFKSTDKDKISSISEEVEKTLEDAKLVLDKENVNAGEVSEQVKKLTEVTKKLKDTIAASDEKLAKEKEVKKEQKDRSIEVDSATNKEKTTADLHNVETSQPKVTKNTARKEETQGKSTVDSEKKKLEVLAKNLNKYYKTASEITRPETKELVKGMEEVVRSVEDGLENSKLTASEIEELLKRGKEAEKKLALAVTREHSGKRDLDNGKKILPDSYFRAATYYRSADGKLYDTENFDNLAKVGYITKENDGSGYPPGTILYISHNDNGSGAGNNNNNLGPQPVKYLKNKVKAEVTKNSNGYHWKIIYNDARESRQNPIYYFTLPSGHSVTRMTLSENGAVVKQGGVREVFNGAADKYLTAVGSPISGVNGTPYYENVANTQNDIVGNRSSIYTLDDFVKNDTRVYYNRYGMSDEAVKVMDKLYEKIKSSTQNVFAFRPRDYNVGNRYIVEFDTVGDTEAPLYYIAGMKSYEAVPSGRYMHKSYQQWNRVQERYNITVDTNKAKTVFLKGTGIGDFDDSTALRNGAVTIEDTYDHNRKTIPSGNDIRDYKTYKPVGNESSLQHTAKNRHNAYTYVDNNAEFNTTTADSTKGNHTTYVEAYVKGQLVNFILPFRVVSQSDVYQPVAKTVQDVKSYAGTLGDAANYIERYDNVSSKIPGFKTPNSDDMTSRLFFAGKFFKDRIEDFPTTSARIKEQAVKSVEWVGGSNDLTTGARVIELTVDGKK